MRNSIIIPCYNESKRLPFDQFANFLKFNKDYQVCFVNDGSKDNTLECLEDFCLNHNNAIFFDMPQNGGKAEAVRTGINYVLNKFSVESVGFLDADLSTSLEDYKGIVNTLFSEKKSVVFGSRKIVKNKNIKRSKFREFASFMVGLTIQIILGLPIKDTQCGAKVFTNQAARKAFKDAFISRWIFDVEVFIKLKKWFGKEKIMEQMIELPLAKWEDVDGSKITLTESIRMPMQILNIGLNYRILPIINELKNIDKIRLVILKKAYSLFF